MADHSNLSVREFQDDMVKNKRCYLKRWQRGADGSTQIRALDFGELPERVIDTTDNPFRGLVGELQHDKLMGRSAIEFSQFTYAESLVAENVVSWDEISLNASPNRYQAAYRRAAAYFEDKMRLGPPGSPAFEDAMAKPRRSCENVF